MSKDKEPKVKRIKKQRSYWQQQELRQRITGIIGVTIVAVVVVIMASGWFFRQYLPIDRHMRADVMEVCGEKYNMAYFVNMLTYVSGEYIQFAEYFLDSAERSIEDSAIVRIASAKLGITVTDDDVKQYIKAWNEFYGPYYGVTIQSNAATRDLVRKQLLEQRLREDYFGINVPATAEYRDVAAMLLESQSQVNEILARLALGESFETLAAEYSLNSTTKSDSALGAHPKGVFDTILFSQGMDDAIFKQPVGSLGVYYDDSSAKSIGYWLVKVTGRDEDKGEVRVSGMLLSSLEEAKDIKSRLDRGESFVVLAEQYSQCWSDEDKDDLGWMKYSDINKAYAAYVSGNSTAIGKVSDPIEDTDQETKGGYWLFKVVSVKADENVSAEDRATLIDKAYKAWLEELKADTQTYSVISYLDEDKRDFAVSRAGK
ncbi:MAG: peptidylprolyl isomerase [Dehalococcoidia bacterium]|nr:peptidylprolyl isomerase [Dehalococcoidia bacterium]